MAKQKVKKGMAVFAIVAAIFLTLTMVTPLALGESETATDISGFDKISASGCTDDTVVYHSADESIYLLSGWGKFEMDDFTTVDIDFYVYFSSVGEHFYLTIEDEDDSSNHVEIRIRAYSQTRTFVGVEDAYKGEGTGTTNNEYVDTYQTWQKVSINIVKTEKSSDLTVKEVSIDVGGIDIIENFELKSGEISTETKERKWNDVTFESKASDEDVNVDDIDIDTGTSSTYGYNITILIVVFLLVGTAFVWYFKVWPLNGKVGFLKPVSRKVR